MTTYQPWHGFSACTAREGSPSSMCTREPRPEPGFLRTKLVLHYLQVPRCSARDSGVLALGGQGSLLRVRDSSEP